MTKVGIIGGTGYTGVELLRLLVQHPQVEIHGITSRGEAGRRVGELFPNLRGHLSLRFSDPGEANLGECEVVFSATPTGVAMGYARELLAKGTRIIDIGADFRIRDRATWEQWYGMEHLCPELLEEAVYGLPELNRERIRDARLVANPGCYPTAVGLALLPLVEGASIDLTSVIADAKSGTSGAGRGAKVGTLLAEAADSLKAYAAAGHRHRPEIEQTLTQAAGTPVNVTFVPHLTPMIRGIHATVYARCTLAGRELQEVFEERYAGEPFVDVLPPGEHPDTRSTRGANFCRIAAHRQPDSDFVIVLSVIDNLVKGAAGQALQNMNIMLGYDETLGLTAPALLP